MIKEAILSEDRQIYSNLKLFSPKLTLKYLNLVSESGIENSKLFLVPFSHAYLGLNWKPE